jgi:hypothetical protein
LPSKPNDIGTFLKGLRQEVFMADEKSLSERANAKADSIFEGIGKYLVEKITTFVTFLFLLFAAGMLYGRFIIPQFPGIEIFLLAGPFVIALIAYYNRLFAIIAFVILALFILL